jgi:hypothetical protein
MDEQEFRSILSDYEKMNDAAEKEVAALREQIISRQATIDQYSTTIAELRAECVEWATASLGVEVYITGLREAIAAWPAIFRKENESLDFFELFERIAEINAARENARRVAGLED